MIELDRFESIPASALSIKYRKLIYGFGVNDAPFVTQIQVGSKKHMHPAYDCWKQMIRRCYSKESLSKKPHYAGVTVCNEWKSFNAFHSWWKESKVDGWQIDKDILTDNYSCSPDNCIFVPKWLNTFPADARLARGRFLIGVTFNKKGGKFEAYCNNLHLGKQEYLGCFDDEMSAHLAWRKRKIEMANMQKIEMDAIDARIYPRILLMIDRMV